MSTPVSRAGATYQIGDAIQGRWVVRSICGGPGRSGMGIVYIVDDRLREETLAVKTWQPQWVTNARVRDLLHQEARLWLAMGRHPHIVPLEFVDALGTQIYLFMHYVAPDASGRNCLSQFLLEQPLPDETVARWSLQICAALLHMQASGVQVHRDLKPDNLMVARSGEMRVTDFGLSRAFSGLPALPTTDRMPRATVIGGVTGTPGYIAPEIIQGADPSVASDLYAFGLVLVQMVTGKPWAPFTAQWRGDVIEYERESLQIRERLHEPLPDSPFGAVAAQCLAFDPARRFSSFDELQATLRSLFPQAGAAVRPPATSTSSRASAADDVFALYKLGELEQALDLVVQQRRTHGDDVHLLTCEGCIRCDLGQLDPAIALLRLACEVAPWSCSHWNNLGRTLRRAQRVDEALQAFERAIACDPTHANLWTSKGNCLVDLGRHEAAIDAFERAALIDPYYWATHLGRALALANLGRLVDALIAVEALLDVEPDSTEGHRLHEELTGQLKSTRASWRDAVERSNALYAQARHAEALQVVREARLRDSPSAALWNNEGIFLTELKDYRGALRCFERALRADPHTCNPWTNKGRVLRRLGDPHEALRCHEQASTLSPHESIPWFNQYTCLRDLGLEERAEVCLRRACATAHTDSERDMCRIKSPDLYYAVMAERAFAAKDYAEAYRCAASVSYASPWHAESCQWLARARFYLAVQFVEHDLANEANGFASAIHSLERAQEDLASETERNVVGEQLDIVCQQYIRKTYGPLAQAQQFEQAGSLLTSVLEHCRSPETLQWARRELAVVLANRAVAQVNAATHLRQEWINLLVGEPC